MKQIITSLITLAVLSSALILPAPSKASDPSDEADKQLEKTIKNIYKPIINRTLPDSAIPMACNVVETLLVRAPMNNTRIAAHEDNYIKEVALAVTTLSYKCDRGKDHDGNIKRYAKMHADAVQKSLIEFGRDEKESKVLSNQIYTNIVAMVRVFQNKN